MFDETTAKLGSPESIQSCIASCNITINSWSVEFSDCLVCMLNLIYDWLLVQNRVTTECSRSHNQFDAYLLCYSVNKCVGRGVSNMTVYSHTQQL